MPDPLRTELVKAWIVARAGVMPSEVLAQDIQKFVRTRPAAHEYPRVVAFVDEMPMTATGEIIHKDLRARG